MKLALQVLAARFWVKQMKNFKRNGLLITEAISLLVLFVQALVLEAAFTVSVFWQFYAVMAFLSLLVTLPSFLSSQRRQTWWLFLTFNVSVFALHFVAFSPVKPFMQFQRDINNGMTIQQVQSLFVQRFPENGRFRQPEWRVGDTSPITEPHLNWYNRSIAAIYARPNRWAL